MNRITGSNYEDSLRSKLVNSTIDTESFRSRIFHFGQVINNTDPQNLNRIKIRIPIIDDVFYVNNTKDEGDNLLPWCISISHRFIDIPEVNSIVIVSILDTKTPYYGRIYFDTISESSTTDIFNRTLPEINSLSNWENVEKIFQVTLNSKPANNTAYNAKANIDYRTGVRGKGKNKFELLQTSSIWTQNEGTDQYSYVQLSEDIKINSSNNIDILSTKGGTHYNPIFHQPLYDYLQANLQLLQKIVILLNTVPAISPDGPCIPGTNASQVASAFTSLIKSFQTFKQTGNSKKITIN